MIGFLAQAGRVSGTAVKAPAFRPGNGLNYAVPELIVTLLLAGVAGRAHDLYASLYFLTNLYRTRDLPMLKSRSGNQRVSITGAADMQSKSPHGIEENL